MVAVNPRVDHAQLSILAYSQDGSAPTAQRQVAGRRGLELAAFRARRIAASRLFQDPRSQQPRFDCEPEVGVKHVKLVPITVDDIDW